MQLALPGLRGPMYPERYPMLTEFRAMLADDTRHPVAADEFWKKY